MLKKLIKENLNYYLSKNEYYDSVATENGFLNKISSNLLIEPENILKSEQKILFNNKISVNSTMEDVTKELGKYNYQLEKSKALGHSIVFYKKMIASFRSRFELHFIEDQFILGFITFDVPNTLNKLKVINALAEKYEVEAKEIDLDLLRIEDDCKNYIQVIDSVNLTLAYGNRSKTNNQMIYNLTHEKERAKRNSTERESLKLQNNL